MYLKSILITFEMEIYFYITFEKIHRFAYNFFADIRIIIKYLTNDDQSPLRKNDTFFKTNRKNNM